MSEHHQNDTQAAEAERQQQEQVRIHTGERQTMDDGDLEEAIDHEHDQKVEPGDESRYQKDVEEALPDDKG